MEVAWNMCTEIDKHEARIIELLQKDGRISFADMARESSISESTIRKKLKRLLERKFISVTAITDAFAVGFDNPVIIGIKTERKSLDDVAKKLSELPEVQFVAVTTGPYGIYVRANFKNTQELSEFLLNRIMRVDGIKDTDTFLILKTYKDTGEIGVVRQ